MASDDVPVCSRRSWPWRAGSRAGSLRPVVLVAFTNVIPTARRASRLWATTYHSERRRNNNYNINLAMKIVEGSRWIPGARDDLGLSLRSESDSWVANLMYTRLTESPRVRKDSSIYSFLGSGGRGHDVTTVRARAIITQARGTALTHRWVPFLAPSESLSTGPAGGATKERRCGGRPQLVPPRHMLQAQVDRTIPYNTTVEELEIQQETVETVSNKTIIHNYSTLLTILWLRNF